VPGRKAVDVVVEVQAVFGSFGSDVGAGLFAGVEGVGVLRQICDIRKQPVIFR
jgi:hypothetical protein